MLYLVGIASAVQSAGGSSDYSSGGKKKENEAYSMSNDGRFGDVQLLISQKNYEKAYLVLSKLSIVDTDEADRQNLLGFTARKHGELTKAGEHYKNALSIDPKHRGALEYQGELFLMIGQIENAKLNLEKLKKQCWLGCLELSKLQKAIDKH